MKKIIKVLFIFFALTGFTKAQSTVTDFDGNTYQTVVIGNQVWMKENLKTTHYADGTPLVSGTGAGDITGNYTTKYYFWYNDDSATYSETYGALYTWAAVMNGAVSSDNNPSGVQGVCLDGWHLPGDTEWKELEMYLGMSQVHADSTGWRGTDEGGKLKETGTIHWISPNTGATNISGYSGLPGGYRYSLGTFDNIGSYGYWWSATEYTAYSAWRRTLVFNDSEVERTYDSKLSGFSVRCVKNSGVTPPLSGTYSIGTLSSDFLNFTHAVDSLKSVGISGPVVFDVESGTYNEQISIPEIIGASETNTIIFQSESGDSTDVILTYASSDSLSNYTLKLNGTDYAIFRNMTLSTTGTDFTRVIELANGAENNEFSYNQIIGGIVTTPSVDFFTDLYNKSLIVSIPDSTTENSNNLFEQNYLKVGFTGIYYGGYSFNRHYESGTLILDNTFEDQLYAGIRLINQHNAFIQANTIQINSDYNWAIGIICKYCGDNFYIEKNKINISGANPSETGGIVHVYSDASLGSEILIANNFIHVHSENTQPDAVYGIITHQSSYQILYYNSINVTGLYSGSASVIVDGTSSNCILENNIFVNNSQGYSIYSLAGITSNHNNLFTNGTNIGYWNYEDIATLAEWRGTSGQDANSISIDPEYLSDSDLHIANPFLKAGTPLAEVTDDIDGDTRDATIPFIGADELTGLQIDSLALVALYDSTDGASWTNKSNWLLGNVSTWYGISVSGDRVTEINLPVNNLVGTIPHEIGNLTNLTYLNLRSNQLSGSIPPEIGNLFNLQTLTLWGNQLSGSIPPEISNLSNLTSLELMSNDLSGSIPIEIANLSNLTWLNLGSNQLSGSIPAEIGNLTNLSGLFLYDNQLSGTIPTQIGNITNLYHLVITNTQISGSIPPEIGNLTNNLTYLELNSNNLSGSVPPEITNLAKLKRLFLYNNQLSDLPNLAPVDSLDDLQIHYNKFTFKDIEPNIGVPDDNFTYSPQDSVGEIIDTTVYAGTSFTLSVSTGGDNSQYQWKKDEINFGTVSSDSTYTVSPVVSSDSGTYTCEITNTVAIDLTLYSRPIHVTITGGPIISDFPYSEDFESGNGGWYTGGANSSWQLGNPAGPTINTTSSGSAAWVTNLAGDYYQNEISYIISPRFNLSDIDYPKIEFSIWWHSEGFYDGANFQYKQGTGVWKTLGTDEGDDSWYNSSYLYSIEKGFGFDINNSAGWSGDGEWGYGSDGWVTVSHALTGIDNTSVVTFRIAFASNSSYENDGVAIDDINIFSDPTGINPVETRLSDIQIYPNPNEGKFRLVYNGERDVDLKLQLINLQGQVILSEQIEAGYRFSKEFELEYLSAGIYYFRLMHNEGVVVMKMVVK